MENSHSAELGLLFEALAKAQGKIENALKDKKNPFFKSSYADLASVWDACRTPLSTNGLAIIQTVEGTREGMFLNTWLGHSSGQWMTSKLPMIVMKQDPQSVGSAITYARRYALSALVGICPDEDDDGEKAMGRKNEKSKIEDIQSRQMDPIETATIVSSFVESFPSEERELLLQYLEKYAGHWKKTLLESIKDYENKEKLSFDFYKWKNKQKTA